MSSTFRLSRWRLPPAEPARSRYRTYATATLGGNGSGDPIVNRSHPAIGQSGQQGKQFRSGKWVDRPVDARTPSRYFEWTTQGGRGGTGSTSVGTVEDSRTMNFAQKIHARWIAVQSDEAGASLVEYALLVALIALVAVVAVRFFGTSLSSSYNDIGNSLP